NLYVSALARADRAQDAWHACREYIKAGFQPHEHTVHYIIFAFTTQRQGSMALRVLSVVRGSGVQLNVYIYCIAMRACASSGSMESAMALYRQMIQDGVEPNIRIYDCLLRGCRHCADWRTALTMVTEMEQRGLKPDALAW
ncbi:hypothetical protein JKP88DRAFT_128735, partial [Tribonema minus]